jgi:hypothetical protein
MPKPTKPGSAKRISVITNAKGKVIATDFRMSSEASYGDAPVQSRLVALKGQRLYELDLPTDVKMPTHRSAESAVAEFHKYLEPLVRAVSFAKQR